MTHVPSRADFALLILAALCCTLSCGCQHGQPASTGVAEKTDTPGASRDHLLGWYQTADGHRLIPVLKANGEYYSVCRGFEVPFKESPAGLAWAVTPSSMTGTTIGIDPESKSPYIAVFDAQASDFTEGRNGSGEKQALTRIDPPAGLLDAQTPQPRSNDDFLGWYQPVWFPYMRWELRKDGEGWISVHHELQREGGWGAQGEEVRLTPLVGRLGLRFDPESEHVLVFNDTLGRFEIVREEPPLIRMPLARIAPPASMSDTVPMSAIIGIPSWH